MTDWKQQYDELAKLAENMARQVRSLENVISRITNHIALSDRRYLRDIQSHRFLRVKETIRLQVDYVNAPSANDPSVTFAAGSLIEAELSNNRAIYRIDKAADGYVYFPAESIEEVLLKDDEIDWDKVYGS